MFCSLTLVLSEVGVRVPNLAVFCLVSCSLGMLPRLLLLLIPILILLLLRLVNRNAWDLLFRIHFFLSFERPFSLLMLMLVWNSRIVHNGQVFHPPDSYSFILVKVSAFYISWFVSYESPFDIYSLQNFGVHTFRINS
jgi:hypothetical protein